jgi:mRNA interferase RelE/StbE
VPYEVRFTAAARRDLHGIPPRVLPAIIEFAFGELSRKPHRVGKPLARELAGSFGARRGPYRLLYRVDEQRQLVHVLRVAHRSAIYRSR